MRKVCKSNFLFNLKKNILKIKLFLLNKLVKFFNFEQGFIFSNSPPQEKPQKNWKLKAKKSKCTNFYFQKNIIKDKKNILLNKLDNFLFYAKKI